MFLFSSSAPPAAAASSPPSPSQPETVEPAGFVEAVHVLRTPDPRYDAILHPSEEQLENLNAVIKGLRLELDNGVDDATGDSTAYELAVALLWHVDRALIEEGMQLMEFLLKGRWDQHWSTVVRPRIGDADDAEMARRHGVQSVADDDADDVSADTVGPHADSCETLPGVASQPATTTASGVLYGSAVQFATAPPPPEDECNSVPPSLVRDRGSSPLVARVNSAIAEASASSWAASAAAQSAAAPSAATPSGSARQTSSTCFTSPGTMSCSTDKATSSSSRGTDAHDERLSRCYYHLAVGHTKLRRNDKALFFLSNALELAPRSEDVLLLRRLVSARVLVRRYVFGSLPLLALGLLFL